MKTLLLFSSLLFLLFNDTNSKKVTKTDLTKSEIKEIWMYDYFEVRGYSMEEVWRTFNHLEANNHSKTLLSERDTNFFKTFFKTSKAKKQFQRKMGQNILFMEIITESDEVYKIALSPTCLSDFTNRKDYWIKNQEDQIRVKEIMEYINQ